MDARKNWTKEQIVTALKRGPHVSTKNKTALKCLHEETEENLKGGYSRKTTWGQIKDNFPPNLKISPLVMIPHKSTKFWCIFIYPCDLKNKQIQTVNLSTALKA